MPRVESMKKLSHVDCTWPPMTQLYYDTYEIFAEGIAF